jgi:inorganic pyrophosphatase
MSGNKYTNAEDYLGKKVKVKMDRPLHSKHPKHGWEYELNYGFVPDTKSPDGEELDAYVIGVDEPVDEFEGICVAIIHRTDDDDDKLIVVTPDQTDISDEDIRSKTHFQEQWFISVIVR